MCTVVKKQIKEILAAKNSSELVVEIRPCYYTTCIMHVHVDYTLFP